MSAFFGFQITASTLYYVSSSSDPTYLTTDTYDPFGDELNGGTQVGGSSGASFSTTSAATSDIQAIYEAVLGRSPNANDLTAARNYLASGASVLALQQAIAYGQEAKNDINYLYVNLLNRAADPGGLASYQAVLASPGGSLSSVRSTLAHSSGAAANINTLYEEVLGRAVDPTGLASSESALSTGSGSLNSLKVALAQSAGAAANINTLYEEVLGRAVDPTGLASSESALGSPTGSLTSLKGSLALSAGAASGINAIYESVLGRAVDPSGLSTEQTFLATPSGSLTQARYNIAYGPEASGDINTIYETVLGRAVDPSGLSTEQAFLATPSGSLTQARYNIAYGPEASGDINTIYETVLGRAVDPSGLSTEQAFLATPSGSLSMARSNIAYGPEASGDISSQFQSLVGVGIDQNSLNQLEAGLAAPGGNIAVLPLSIANLLASNESTSYDNLNPGVNYADKGIVFAGNGNPITVNTGPGLSVAGGGDPGTPDPGLSGTAAQINNFFFVQEGGNYLNGYVPQSSPGVYSTTSGVTVGIGTDLSQQNAIGLALDGVPQSIINSLIPYLGVGYSTGATMTIGKTGITAENLLLQKGPSFLTAAQVSTLNSDLESVYVTSAENQWNAANNGHPLLTWNQLPQDAQVGLAWMDFSGNLGTNTNFWTQTTSGNWLQSVHNLQNWHTNAGVPIPDQPTSDFLGVAQMILKAYSAPGSLLPTSH